MRCTTNCVNDGCLQCECPNTAQKKFNSRLVAPTKHNHHAELGLSYLPMFGSAAKRLSYRRYVYRPTLELPCLARRVPSYRLHKARGLAVVTIDG